MDELNMKKKVLQTVDEKNFSFNFVSSRAHYPAGHMPN
jgi:hypothetical protein